MRAAGAALQGALNVLLAFRADASSRIGSGHVVRCRHLASRLREVGHETLFLICNPSQELFNQLLNEGNKVCVLTGSLPEVFEAQDAIAVRKVLANCRPDWLVVDHYALGEEWEAAMRKVASRLMVIDDLGRSHDCDLLLDQGWLGDASDAYPSLICEKLLGPRFALLHPAYARIRTQVQRYNVMIQRILVYFGGADGTGQTLHVLEAIDDLRFSHLHFDVVVGAENIRCEGIRRRAVGLTNVHIIEQRDNLASLMFEADLFIGAGGAITWERCCLGLPAIVCWTAENQKLQTLALAAIGVQVQVGSAVEQTPESWRKSLLSALVDTTCPMLGVKKGADLVDGLGVERVVSRLTNIRSERDSRARS